MRLKAEINLIWQNQFSSWLIHYNSIQLNQRQFKAPISLVKQCFDYFLWYSKGPSTIDKINIER